MERRKIFHLKNTDRNIASSFIAGVPDFIIRNKANKRKSVRIEILTEESSELVFSYIFGLAESDNINDTQREDDLSLSGGRYQVRTTIKDNHHNDYQQIDNSEIQIPEGGLNSDEGLEILVNNESISIRLVK